MIVNVSAATLNDAFKVVQNNGYENIINIDSDPGRRYWFSVDKKEAVTVA